MPQSREEKNAQARKQYAKYKNDKEWVELRYWQRLMARKKNPEKYRQHERNAHQRTLDMDHHTFFTRRVSRCNLRSKRINLDCDIDALYLKEIFPQDRKCPILNIPFKTGNEEGRFNSPSLDRINNLKGYVRGNLIWVSQLANNIKSSATPDQIIAVGKFYKQLEEEGPPK